MSQIPIRQPPIQIPPIDQNRSMPLVWQNWFIDLALALNTDLAPADATYLVQTSDPLLTGALVVAGTANQIILTPGVGTMTFSAPQNIGPTSRPQFASLGVGTTAPVSPAAGINLLATGTLGAAGVGGLNQAAFTLTLSGANPTTYATEYAALIGAMTLVGTNAGQTVTEGAGLVVSPAIKSTNVALTTTHGILVPAVAVSTASTAYGLSVNTPTGASANYAAQFLGGNVGIGTGTPTGTLAVTAPAGISAVILTGGTQTANFPVWSATQTWNNAAVDFTGMKFDVTKTANGPNSLLLDLHINSVSKFSLLATDGELWCGGGMKLGNTRATYTVLFGSNFRLNSTSIITWSNVTTVPASGNADTDIGRDGAGILYQRHSTSPMAYRLYNTFTDASNNEYCNWGWASNVLHLGTIKNGSGTARVLQIDYGGTTTAAISIPITSGALTFGGQLNPVLTTEQLRLAYDGSNYASFTVASAGSLTIAPTGTNPSITLTPAGSGSNALNGPVSITDAKDVTLGTSTGTKIGTATSQKIGLWNVTPIIQPASANQAAITDSTTGTPASSLVDVTTLGVADPVKVNDNFASLLVLVTAMRTAMVNLGSMKGAA